MEDFDKLIEKYRSELIEFSKSNPIPDEVIESSAEIEEAVPAANDNVNTNCETEKIEECDASPDKLTEVTAEEDEPITNNIESEKTGVYVAPQFADYAEFIKNNPQSGSLRVQVSAANEAFPIPNARVTVVLELLNGPREMYDGLTDINGIIDNIKLPAPDSEMSQSPSSSGVLPYSTYTTYVEHPDFVKEKFTNVPVFSGIKSIQGVELISRVNYGNQPESIVQNEGESFTRLKGVE